MCYGQVFHGSVDYVACFSLDISPDGSKLALGCADYRARVVCVDRVIYGHAINCVIK